MNKKRNASILLSFLITINVFIADNLKTYSTESDYLGAYDKNNNFGIANDFNLFIFGDVTQDNVDSEGRVAVGGKATLSGYGVGSKLAVSNTRADLIIGGDVDITAANNSSGNTVVSSSSKIIRYNMSHSNNVKNQPIRLDIIDFVKAKEQISKSSLFWSNYKANGTIKLIYGNQIVLEGTDPKLNVFKFNGNNIDGNGLSFNQVGQISINVPEYSTVLINIGGDNIGFGNYSIFFKGANMTSQLGQYILWNFYEGTKLWNNNITIKGSVLAPNADWVANGSGNVEGNFIAKSLKDGPGSHHLEAHNYLFKGNLPPVADENSKPEVPDYSVTTTKDTPVSGTVVGTDDDEDILIYKKYTDPTNGTVVVNLNGTWIYTPNKGYTGTDTFKVEVSDGKGGTAISTVTVTVMPDATSAPTSTLTPTSTPTTPPSNPPVVIIVTSTQTPAVPTATVVREEPTKEVPRALAKVPSDLAVLIDSQNMRTEENKIVKYNITYFNKMNNDVGKAFVKVNIPNKMQFVTADGNGKATGNEIKWELGTLKGNVKGTLTFSLKATSLDINETIVSLLAEIYSEDESIELINISDDKSKIETMIYTNKNDHYHRRYIMGYPDGNVKPKGFITRAEVAAIFARILDLKGNVKGKEVYKDVGLKFWAAGYIEVVSEKGLFKGYYDDTFRPNKPITRAELAIVISNYLKVNKEAKYDVLVQHFKDLAGHWAEDAVEEIYRYGIINGYNDGTFQPDKAITREETIKMVNQTLYRGPLKGVNPSYPDNPESNWSFGHIEEATRSHTSKYNEDGSEGLLVYTPEELW